MSFATAPTAVRLRWAAAPATLTGPGDGAGASL